MGRISAGRASQRAESARSSPLDKASGVEVAWPQVSELFNAARDLDRPEFVYFIGEGGDNGPVKIGMSRDPLARLRSMQTGNSRALRIEFVLIGGRPLERSFHGIWEQFSIVSPRRQGKVAAAPGTEWFESEIRASLFPVVEAAVVAQVECLRADFEPSALSEAVFAAHEAAGISLVPSDEIRAFTATGIRSKTMPRLRKRSLVE